MFHRPANSEVDADSMVCKSSKAETLSHYKGCRYSMGWTPRIKTKREREDGRAVRLAPELRGHETEASDSESNSQRTQG